MTVWTIDRLGLAAGLAMLLGASQCVVVPPPVGGGYGVPQGSYLASCSNPFVTGNDVLRADCADRTGRYREASLQLPCSGDIANRDGALVCRDGRPDGPPQAEPPRGSYRQDCINARVTRGNVLEAECRTRSGRYEYASLQLPCRGDIALWRGDLVCDDGGSGGPVTGGLPRGSYLERCSDARVLRGDILQAQCLSRDGRTVVSSLQLPCYGDIAFSRGSLICER